MAQKQNKGDIKMEKIYENKKEVNKTAYCLLALFLGQFGIHKFYAGKTKAGILYIVLAFFGISVILAFVDFIIAVFKKKVNGRILI